jgi:hypothetical protein
VVNPRVRARGDTVSTTPTAITAKVVSVITAPALLRKNGTRWVRMAKMMSVWVAADSTNHPVRNSTGRRA